MCPAEGDAAPLVVLQQATVSKAASVTTLCFGHGSERPPEHTLSATLTNNPPGGEAAVSFNGTDDDWVRVSEPGSHSLQRVREGSRSRMSLTVDSNGNPGKMLLRRNIQVPGDATPLDLDFSGGVPFSIATAQAWASDGAPTVIDVCYVPSHESGICLPAEVGARTSFPLVPASLVEPGDEYLVVAAAVSPPPAATEPSPGHAYLNRRVCLLALHDPDATTTLRLPDPLPADVRFLPEHGTARVIWPKLRIPGTEVDWPTVYMTDVKTATVRWTAVTSQGGRNDVVHWRVTAAATRSVRTRILDRNGR